MNYSTFGQNLQIAAAIGPCHVLASEPRLHIMWAWISPNINMDFEQEHRNASDDTFLDVSVET